MDPVPPQTLQGRRIMLVEDEMLVAMLMQEMLEEHGATVMGPFLRVEDAQTFLAHNRLPDAAVLDVNIAGEAVYPIAEVLDRNGILFVFMSGGDSRDLPSSFNHVPYFEKPIDSQALVPLLSLL